MKKQLLVRVLTGVVVVSGAWGSVELAAGAEQRFAEAVAQADKPDKKTGTVSGTLSAKAENWIEIKADGEEKARRYFPRWIGGLPKDGGGLDKNMLKTFRELKVGSRVRLQWESDERPRAVKIEVLKAAAK